MVLLPDKTQTSDGITPIKSIPSFFQLNKLQIQTTHTSMHTSHTCIQHKVSYPLWCTGVSTHSDAEAEGDLQTACGVQGIL